MSRTELQAHSSSSNILVLAKDAHLFYSYELGIKEFILIFQSCEECILQQNPLQSDTKCERGRELNCIVSVLFHWLMHPTILGAFWLLFMLINIIINYCASLYYSEANSTAEQTNKRTNEVKWCIQIKGIRIPVFIRHISEYFSSFVL